MTLGPFRLRLNANGSGEVVVGDVDLAGMTGAVSLVARPGEPPRLVVELIGEAAVEGVADISVVRSGAGLAEFFANIDAEELEREALTRLGGFDDTGTTRAILDVLAEWVQR